MPRDSKRLSSVYFRFSAVHSRTSKSVNHVSFTRRLRQQRQFTVLDGDTASKVRPVIVGPSGILHEDLVLPRNDSRVCEFFVRETVTDNSIRFLRKNFFDKFLQFFSHNTSPYTRKMNCCMRA